MTSSQRVAALATVLALLLAACTQADAPTGQCPAGTQRGADGVSCVPLEDESTEGDAAQRAAEAHERAYDNCRNEGNPEDYCIQNFGPP